MPTPDDAKSTPPSILLTEFQHYVRNMLAVVRSLIRRGAHASTSVEEVCGALDGRVGALGRAQAHLASAPLRGAEFETILRDELLAHRLHVGDAIVLDGPALPLPWRSAVKLTLAVHELLTNAIRHGALADADGRLRIDWDCGEDRRSVRICWDERFGTRPAAATPAGYGFGWEYLEATLAYELDADVALALETDGFRCDIAFPLPDAS